MNWRTRWSKARNAIRVCIIHVQYIYLCACSSSWRTRASTCGSGTCAATRSAGRTWNWTPTGTRSSGASRETRWPSMTCLPRSTTSGAARARISSSTRATRWAPRWASRSSLATRSSPRASKCSPRSRHQCFASHTVEADPTITLSVWPHITRVRFA